MKKTAFFNHLEKHHVSNPKPYWDYYNSLVDETWFRPYNGETDDYTLSNSLYDFGLLAKRVTPIWSGGTFRGYEIDFLKVKIDAA